MTQQRAKEMRRMPMTLDRIAELRVPLENGRAEDISDAWAARLLESFDTIESLLRLPAETGAVEGWRPIESAPKDGRWLLGWWRDDRVESMRWAGRDWSHFDGDTTTTKPTHWMPLPPAPTTDSRPSEEQR